MNILQLTPGAGTMYCGNCLRDNALVAGLRALGHQVLMVPLYLPLTRDETDQSAGTPVFFSGINVYLDQKSALFRRAPRWVHHLLAAPSLLKWAARQSARTKVESLGPLTLSMLRGEAGNQAPELVDLLGWLKTQPAPEVIFLSNALLLGMARRLKQELNRPLVCMLQGEDYFLDSLPEPHRAACWQTLAERARDADLFIAPSHYFAELMQRRLRLPSERIKVVYNGINLEGYQPKLSEPAPEPSTAERQSAAMAGTGPVLGYLARLCKEKGLDLLIDAFIELRRRQKVPGLKLCIAGSLGLADEAFVSALRQRLQETGLAADASFYPNVDRPTKLTLLKSFSVFSVPALYGEAFGLYIIEALAAGVPVVQPRAAAFPELLELTGGGILCEPGKALALADAIELLLLDSQKASAMAVRGQRVVFEQLSAQAMAEKVIGAVGSLQRESAFSPVVGSHSEA